MKQMITAHRGCTEYGDHENTIQAIAKAVEIGCHAVEIDVRKTKDNQFVLHHDEDLFGVLISKLDYSEIVAQQATLAYRVPLLEGVLQQFAGKIHFDIELKELGDEEEIVKLIKKYLTYSEFFIRSFVDRSIRKVKKLDPRVITGLILGLEKPRYGLIGRLSELFPLVRILTTGCDFVSPHYRLCVFGYLRRMRILKKPVIVWTVNESRRIQKLLDQKVAGIISDYPTKTLELYRNDLKN